MRLSRFSWFENHRDNCWCRFNPHLGNRVEHVAEVWLCEVGGLTRWIDKWSTPIKQVTLFTLTVQKINNHTPSKTLVNPNWFFKLLFWSNQKSHSPGACQEYLQNLLVGYLEVSLNTTLQRPATARLSRCRFNRHHGNWVEQSAEVKQCRGSVQQRLGWSDVV